MVCSVTGMRILLHGLFKLLCCCLATFLQLSALVLSKLLSSLPTMRRHLRAGYLLGDTRSDKTGSLAMNNKVQQAAWCPGYRVFLVTTPTQKRH